MEPKASVGHPATPERWDVLVVDDEPVVGRAVCRVLEAEGLRVATVSNGAEALAHPALSSCRLALCDLVLPDGSGLDLIRKLRKCREGLAVVLVTGYATPAQEARAREAGAVAFMAKPFDEAELLQIVQAVLASETAALREKQP